MKRSIALFGTLIALSLACANSTEGPKPKVAVASVPAKSEPAPLPSAVEAKHGEVCWAVYAALGDPQSAEHRAVQARAKGLELELLQQDPNCNVPVEGKAAPPKPTDDTQLLLAAYFATEADARAVGKRLGEPVWIGEVRTMCLD